MVFLGNIENLQVSDDSKIERIAKHVEAYFFDLNKTIAAIEGGVVPEILEEITKLSKTKKIIITSGRDYNGLKERFLNYLGNNFNKANLFLAPTNGAKLIKFDEKGQISHIIYEYPFSKKESMLFLDIIKQATRELNLNNGNIFFRGSQITYSGITNKNNIEEENFEELKKYWDPTKEKRKILKKKINLLIEKNGLNKNDYFIGINGATSIDINKKDENNKIITKAKAIEEIAKYLNLDYTRIAYIGDGMGKGENDSFSREIPGLNVIEVDGKIFRKGNKTIIPDTLEVVKLLTQNILQK